MSPDDFSVKVITDQTAQRRMVRAAVANIEKSLGHRMSSAQVAAFGRVVVLVGEVTRVAFHRSRRWSLIVLSIHDVDTNRAQAEREDQPTRDVRRFPR